VLDDDGDDHVCVALRARRAPAVVFLFCFVLFLSQEDGQWFVRKLL